MKNIYTLIFSSFLCGLFLITACQNVSKTPSEKLLTPILFQEQLQTNKGQLIDVRTPEEYASGHILNAKNMDFYANDFNTQLMQLNQEETVYVYCRSGGRSGKTAKQLEGMGFKKVYDLKGGMMAWEKENLEIVQ